MSLIGNFSILTKNPGRYLAGSSTSQETYVRSNWNKQGTMQNAPYRDGLTSALNKWAVIDGAYPPYTWDIPQKSGELSSHNLTVITVGATGTAYGGVTATAPATITVTVADAAGQLITSGTGSASFSVTTNSPLLTASIGGDGTAAITVSIANALLGALADGSGSSAITVSATNSARLPADDTPPARTASASMSVTAGLTAYAIGIMEGTSGGSDPLSPAGLATAVWAAVAASNNDPGSMGELLNNSGAGGNPWTVVLEGTYTAADLVRLMSSAMLGKATGGGGSLITFRDTQDTTDRIVATVDAAGNRSAVVLTP